MVFAYYLCKTEGSQESSLSKYSFQNSIGAGDRGFILQYRTHCDIIGARTGQNIQLRHCRDLLFCNSIYEC